ncbi:hypothetical protein BD770DRAFT_415412 [Pilaira anomala]|nr:hypothetical protein BD770DRAFT_415412 [Pilaira anomala]
MIWNKNKKKYYLLFYPAPNEGQDSDHNNGNVNIQSLKTVHFDKVADTITNHGEINVVNNKASMSVNKGSNRYVFDPPCTSTERPHMPKIRKDELEPLNQLFVFGTQYCVNDPLFWNWKGDPKIDDHRVRGKVQGYQNSIFEGWQLRWSFYSTYLQNASMLWVF